MGETDPEWEYIPSEREAEIEIFLKELQEKGGDPLMCMAA